MANIVLTKSSGEEQIRSYFGAILELSKTDNEFPVNLDDVWGLVYSEKGKATRALREDFIEGVDYCTFAQNGKTATGGFKIIEYRLSIPCLEFFIARKVRRVFEVYRQVFHAVAKAVFKVPKTYSEALRLAADQQDKIEAQKQRIQMIESENAAITEERDKLLPKAQYTDEVLQAPSTYTFSQMAKELNFTGVHTFIARLKALNLIYKQSGQYQLAYRFSGQGYTTTRTARFYHSDGTPDCSVSTVWTEKGRKFLHEYFAKKGVSPCLQ